MPPQATELENAVLGAIMLEPERMNDVMEIIHNEECFYSEANQRIYAAIQRMHNRGARIDIITVCEELKKSNEIEAVGGVYYVTSLTRDVVSSAHIEEHALILMQKYAARDLIKMAGDLICSAYDESSDVFDLIDRVSSYSTEITDKLIKRQFEHIKLPMHKLIINTIEKVNAVVKMFGVPTGFEQLDAITGGWQPTDLIILAARPSVGKTAFALNLLLGAVGGSSRVDLQACKLGTGRRFTTS
jgi:Replicative DNA helicase